MNVLLTCAGRRGFMIEAFRRALRGRGQVFACDASADAPALGQADGGFVVPGVEDGRYLDALLTICRERRVGLLVPALEPELPALAAARARFAEVGTTALVSSPEVVATCYDKLATAAFLTRCGLAAPELYSSLTAAREALARGELNFPVVVKPRWGVSSIGVETAGDDEELELAFRMAGKQIARSFLARATAAAPEQGVLIQGQLAGEEYGLDIVNDLRGRHVATFARRKLRMRSGQTDRAMTVRDERLERVGRTIGENLGHIGSLDGDLFVNEAGGVVIDLNPRIGGGYPFSHLAGADLPAALIAWAQGEAADPAWFQPAPNVTVARGDDYLVLRPRQPVTTGNGPVVVVPPVPRPFVPDLPADARGVTQP